MSLGILDSETLIVNTYFTKNAFLSLKNLYFRLTFRRSESESRIFDSQSFFPSGKILSLFESRTMALNLHKKQKILAFP